MFCCGRTYIHTNTYIYFILYFYFYFTSTLSTFSWKSINSCSVRYLSMTFYLLRDIANVSEQMWKLVENNANSNDIVLFLEANNQNEDSLSHYVTAQGEALDAMSLFVPKIANIVPWLFEPYANNYNMRMEILDFVRNRIGGGATPTSSCGSNAFGPDKDDDSEASLSGQTLAKKVKPGGELDFEKMINYYIEHPEELD